MGLLGFDGGGEMMDDDGTDVDDEGCCALCRDDNDDVLSMVVVVVSSARLVWREGHLRPLEPFLRVISILVDVILDVDAAGSISAYRASSLYSKSAPPEGVGNDRCKDFGCKSIFT